MKLTYSESEVESLTDELIGIGKTDGFLSLQPGGKYNEKKRHIRAFEIGERLNDMGGLELMRKVGYSVAQLFPPGSTAGRELEAAWVGIGSWM